MKISEIESELKALKEQKATKVTEVRALASADDSDVADVQKGVASVDDLQKQIDALKNSTSWRITYPLRLFNSFLIWLTALPVRVARAIARHLLKSLILIVIKINPLRSLASKCIQPYPSLHGHLKRFSIHRGILNTDTEELTTSALENPQLTPHANKIYIALKNSKNNIKD